MKKIYKKKNHGNPVNLIRIGVLTICMLLFTNAWAADRYWVGKDGSASGNTNWENTLNWASTTGGTGGAGVPANTDNVFFDASSFDADGQTVTLDAARTCANMTWENLTYRPVFDMQAVNLIITGSLQLHPNMTVTSTGGTLTFNGAGAAKTIQTANVVIPRAITFNLAAAGWILQDSLKMTGYTLTLTNGSLNLNGNYVKCNAFTFANGTLNMDGSEVELGGNFNFQNGYLTMKGTKLQCVTFDALVNNAKRLNMVNAIVNCTGTWNYSVANALQIEADSTRNSVITAAAFIGRATPIDYYSVLIAGNGVINGANGATFRKIVPFPNNTAARLQGVTTDTLILGMGNSYYITGGQSITVNKYLSNIRLLENCSEMVVLRSNNTAVATVNMAIGATFNLNNVDFYYISLNNLASPGTPYAIAKSGNLGGSSGFTYNNRLYWVGGAGNWNDLSNWSTQPGGTPDACFLPRATTTVVFGNEIGTLYITEFAYCDSMIWLSTDGPQLNMTTADLSISGSLFLAPNMTVNTGVGTYFTFNSSRLGETIKTNNVTLVNPRITFNSSTGGGWILQDSLIIDCDNENYGYITFTNGNLNLNGQYVHCNRFISTATNARQLNIANSTIEMRFRDWTHTGSSSPIIATNSVIRSLIVPVDNSGSTSVAKPITFASFTGNPTDHYNIVSGFNGTIQGGVFNKIIMDKDNGTLNSEIAANNVTTDSLILSAGYNYSIYGGSTVTVNKYLGNTRHYGNCAEKITLTSTTATPALIAMGASSNVDLTNVNIGNVHISGPTIPYPVPNSIDLGGNSGWNLTQSLSRLYWIGGTGNWSDPDHWSSTSGGAPVCAIPTAATTVVFDNNSEFIDGGFVMINIPAFCDSMLWLGTTVKPALFSREDLTINGSLTLQPDMSVGIQPIAYMISSPITTISFRSNRPNETIKTNGVAICNDITFNGNGGWKVQDKLTQEKSLHNSNVFVTLIDGYLDLSNAAFSADNFTTAGAKSSATLNIAGATIDIAANWTHTGGAPLTAVQSFGSLIRMASGDFTGKNDDKYNVLEAPAGTVAYGDFNKILVNKGFVRFNNGNNRYINTDTLLFAPGSVGVLLWSPSMINVSTYLGKTHNGQLAMSTAVTAQATINMGPSSTVKMDSLILSYIQITGPGTDYPTRGSVNRGGNSGWDFQNPYTYPVNGNTCYWRGGVRDGIFNNIYNWEMDFPGSNIMPMTISGAYDYVFPPDICVPGGSMTGGSMTLKMNGSNVAFKNLYFNGGYKLTITLPTTSLIGSENLIIGEGSTLLLRSEGATAVTVQNILLKRNSDFGVTNAGITLTARDTIMVEKGATCAIHDNNQVSGKNFIVKGNVNNSVTGLYHIGPHFIITNELFIDQDAKFKGTSMHIEANRLRVNGTLLSYNTFHYGGITMLTVEDFIINNGGIVDFQQCSGNGGMRMYLYLNNVSVNAGGRWLIRPRDPSNTTPNIRLQINGNFNIAGETYLVGYMNAIFNSNMTVTGKLQLNNVHTYFESPTNPYTFTLTTPTKTTFEGGTFRFNSPVAFSLTENLVMPTTDFYITANNGSFTSNGFDIKSNMINIANGNAAMIGRMLDFSNSLLEVKNFTVNGTRANEHNFATTTVSFWGTEKHNFNANIAASTPINISKIGTVTYTEVADELTCVTGTQGVTIDLLKVGDKSMYLNYTTPVAMTVNDWQLDNTCDIYAPNSPVCNVGKFSAVPAAGTCTGLSRLHSLYGLIRFNATATAITPINLRYLYCTNVLFGPSTPTPPPYAFTSLPNYDLGGNSGNIDWSGVSDPDPVGQTFYWMGNNGNWDDPDNWSLSAMPPRSPAGCLPSMFDDVVFNDYSFTDDTQNVTVTALASVHNMTWTDSQKEGGLILANDLEIYGSVDFTGCRYAYGPNTNARWMLVGTGSETITSGGLINNIGTIIFAHTGTYTLTDDFICSQDNNANAGIWHYSGSLVSNGNNITATCFVSEPAVTGTGIPVFPRNLNLANSTVKLIYNNTEPPSSGNNRWIFVLGTATSNFSNSKIISYDFTTSNTVGQSVTYNDVEVYRNLAQSTGLNATYHDIRSMGGGYFQYGFTAHSLFLKAYNTYQFNRNGTLPNVFIVDTLITDATPCYCNSDTVRTTIRGNNATATLLRVGSGLGSFTIDRAIVERINCTGGDTMIVEDGVLGTNGNITNVTINARAPIAPKTFYWVPNSLSNNGSGNWSDPTHWSIGVSGGDPSTNNPNGCIPSHLDSVKFDMNSFRMTNETVTLDIDGNCKSMNWQTASLAPIFYGPSSRLNIYESLTLDAQINRFAPNGVYMRGTDPSAGAQTIRFNGITFAWGDHIGFCFTGGGRYDILSNYTFLYNYSINNAASFIVQNNSSLHLQSNLNFYDLDINATGSFYSHGYTLYQTGHVYQEFWIRNGAYTVDLSGSTLDICRIEWTISDVSNVNMSNTKIGFGSDPYPNNGYANISVSEDAIFNAANSNMQLESLKITNPSATRTLAFHNVFMNGNNAAVDGVSTGKVSFNKVEYNGNNTYITGGGVFIFDSLIYKQSSTNYIAGGKTINVKYLRAGGSACSKLQLSSTNATPAVISAVGCSTISVCMGRVNNITADISTCTSANYVIYGDPAEQTNAVNWTVYDIDHGIITDALGPDVTLRCADLPYTQTTEAFGIGDFYRWYYKANGMPAASDSIAGYRASSLLIDKPGYYSVYVSYSTSCYLGGPPYVVRRFLDFDTIHPSITVTSSEPTNALSCITSLIKLTATSSDPLGTYQWIDTVGNTWSGDTLYVTNPGLYTATVTASNTCPKSATGVAIRQLMPDDLMDCALMPDVTFIENAPGGVYHHSGASLDATAAPCVTLVDLKYYIYISGTLQPPGTTLNGFDFPLGTTTVVWIAEDDGGLFDTCSYTVTVLMTDLIDCTHTGNVILDEDGYGVGYHTHSGTVPYIMPLSGIVLDSVTYIVADTLITASLNGVRFYTGAPTPVVIIAHLGTNTDTCTLTITVRRVCPTSIPYNGHTYDVIDLAGLCWTSNMETETYADGTPIAWAKPYYSDMYPNTAYNAATFGLLYTWYSAVGVPEGDDTATPMPTPLGFVQGICPDDWHIPSASEWNLLNAYPATDLKSTTLWINGVGTNLTGFNAVPAGMCNAALNKFINLYGETDWWATDSNILTASYYYLAYYCDIIKEITTKKGDGLSVRCVMD